jgi:hypothetical protein
MFGCLNLNFGAPFENESTRANTPNYYQYCCHFPRIARFNSQNAEHHLSGPSPTIGLYGGETQESAKRDTGKTHLRDYHEEPR